MYKPLWPIRTISQTLVKGQKPGPLNMDCMETRAVYRNIKWSNSPADGEVGVTFSSDGRQDNKLDTRIGKASAVMRQLCRSLC